MKAGLTAPFMARNTGAFLHGPPQNIMLARSFGQEIDCIASSTRL